MSGRAGRRGLDDRGIVMLMVDEQMDSTVGKNLLKVRNGCPSVSQNKRLLFQVLLFSLFLFFLLILSYKL